MHKNQEWGPDTRYVSETRMAGNVHVIGLGTQGWHTQPDWYASWCYGIHAKQLQYDRSSLYAPVSNVGCTPDNVSTVTIGNMSMAQAGFAIF